MSDLTKQMSKDYGVLLEDQGISLRGLFIINPEGILRQITMNDLPVGRLVKNAKFCVSSFYNFNVEYAEIRFYNFRKILSDFENCFRSDVDETLRLVQAFQFTDKNGEVCPAGWKPGSATIIPNPQDKIMYFKNKGPFL